MESMIIVDRYFNIFVNEEEKKRSFIKMTQGIIETECNRYALSLHPP